MMRSYFERLNKEQMRRDEPTPIPPLWVWFVMLIVFAGLPFAASGLEAAWAEYNHNLIHMQGAW